MDVEKVIAEIIRSAYQVRGALSAGYLESVYRNALCIELAQRGLRYKCEVPIRVSYRGYIVGEYRADIVVEGQVIVELKAVTELVQNHEIQLVNYLTATGIELGLLINFGEKFAIKRKCRTLPKA